MRIGGWTRIWIVLAALMAIVAGVIAYGTMPTRQTVLSEWYSEAADVLVRNTPITDSSRPTVWEVQQAYFSASEQENLRFLQTLAEGRTERARLSSAEIAALNRTFRQRLDSLTGEQAQHWALVSAWWLATILALYVAGWSVGWVYRGFRQGAA